MSDSVDRRRRLLLGAALSGVAGRAFAQAGASARPARMSRRMEPLKRVDAGVLNFAYYERGSAPTVRSRSSCTAFPSDIHSMQMSPATGGAGLPRHRPLLARLRRDALSRSGDASLRRAGGDRRRCHRADGRARTFRARCSPGIIAGGRAACVAAALWPERLPRHGDREQLPDPGSCARHGADQSEI